jgi:hypothetical protein
MPRYPIPVMYSKQGTSRATSLWPSHMMEKRKMGVRNVSPPPRQGPRTQSRIESWSLRSAPPPTRQSRPDLSCQVCFSLFDQCPAHALTHSGLFPRSISLHSMPLPRRSLLVEFVPHGFRYMDRCHPRACTRNIPHGGLGRDSIRVIVGDTWCGDLDSLCLCGS